MPTGPYCHCSGLWCHKNSCPTQISSSNLRPAETDKCTHHATDSSEVSDNKNFHKSLNPTLSFHCCPLIILKYIHHVKRKCEALPMLLFVTWSSSTHTKFLTFVSGYCNQLVSSCIIWSVKRTECSSSSHSADEMGVTSLQREERQAGGRCCNRGHLVTSWAVPGGNPAASSGAWLTQPRVLLSLQSPAQSREAQGIWPISFTGSSKILLAMSITHPIYIYSGLQETWA